MKREQMLKMSKTDLDDYAKAINLDISGKKTIEKKVDAILERKERTAEIDVLGITLLIPIKRARDKRVTDILAKTLTDESVSKLLMLLLGKDQMDALTEAATDDDGLIDVDALGLATAKIITSPDLKNY